MPMASQIIPLLGIASPGYTPEPLRTITINSTREGQQTSEYKEAVLWASLYDRTELITFVFRDGITSTRSFAASAVDGKRAIMIYDFDAQPYGAVRTLNINQDLELNIDLNDGTGGSGPSFPEGNSKVRGAVQNMDGTPAVGKNIYAYHRDSGAFLSKGILPQDGKFDLHLPTPPTEKILLVAVDPSNEQSPPVLDYVIPEEV